jgi:23S rRNA pseudouridine1911/1915/1917 synthase
MNNMLDVLYEDNHIIAVNKKVSDIVQGDKTGDTPLSDIVKLYIKTKYNKPGNVFLGVTHRLDRPTSGVVLFARTTKALTRLNNMFKSKSEIKKTYWAIVKNTPPEKQGVLRNYVYKNTTKNKSFVCDKDKKGAKEAILDYKLISKSDTFNLIEIQLHTGRHHQIRVQLSNINCPIKGDLKYGYPRSNNNAGISLHARYIEFVHPVTKEIVKIEAPVPDDKLWKFFEESNSGN